MDIQKYLNPRFITVASLRQHGSITATIASVVEQVVRNKFAKDDTEEVVVAFEDALPLVLEGERLRTMVDTLGLDPSRWIGATLEVFAEQTGPNAYRKAVRVLNRGHGEAGGRDVAAQDRDAAESGRGQNGKRPRAPVDQRPKPRVEDGAARSATAGSLSSWGDRVSMHDLFVAIDDLGCTKTRLYEFVRREYGGRKVVDLSDRERAEVLERIERGEA